MPLIGEVRRIQNLQKYLTGAANAPPTPIRAASAHRFAHKRRGKRSAYKIGCGLSIAPILVALWRLYRFPYYARTHL
jgi:hypothetical protein